MMRKNILLNWDSSRADMLEPFVKLKDDFNFSVIWFKSKQKHKKTHPFPEYYFGDYKTPYRLLKELKPEVIVSFGIHSFPQIALNTAAKNKGIPTFTMHHGVFSSNIVAITKMRQDMGIVKKRKPLSSLSSFYFYFSALRWANRKDLFSYLRFPFLLNRYGAVEALKKCVFRARLPDHYIQLSPHNSVFYKELDHLNCDEKFFFIGHPWFDNFFSLPQDYSPNLKNEPPYWLLIDFPNIETNIGFKKIGFGRKKNFYIRLSAFAKKNGCRLKIKLHPSGFDSPYNYKDENIDLIKETDIVSLIQKADKCLGFYSTLLFPIVYLKKHCIVFDLGIDIANQQELVDLGVVTKLDLDSFTEEQLFPPVNTKKYEKASAEFIRRYLYYTDGKATERLKKILSGETV
ncbi:MAG: hypothetical protein LC128_09990 [Chitinophagales bacterium]|nr:hypothetical protein [Chitinophagales bacterium]